MPGLIFLTVMPGLIFLTVMPGLIFLTVMPGLIFLTVMPGLIFLTVMPDLIRHPQFIVRWIPARSRDDELKGTGFSIPNPASAIFQ